MLVFGLEVETKNPPRELWLIRTETEFLEISQRCRPKREKKTGRLEVEVGRLIGPKHPRLKVTESWRERKHREVH